MYENPSIRAMYDRTVIESKPTCVVVHLHWKRVNRTCTKSYLLTYERYGRDGAMALAERLKKAADAGALFMYAREKVDYRGQTYIEAPERVGSHMAMAPQLTKMGY